MNQHAIDQDTNKQLQRYKQKIKNMQKQLDNYNFYTF